MMKKKIFSQVLIVIIIISSILVLLTPWIVEREMMGVKEEVWETIIICFFLMFIYAASFLYFKEFKRLKIYQNNLEERLQETFKYIGSINLQIDEIKRAFSNFKKYPKNDKDIEEVFEFFSEKILSIVNADWVNLKVINLKNKKTLKQIKKIRGKKKINFPNIKNEEILSDKCKIKNCSLIVSDQENLSIKASCILPVKLKNEEERFFIQSVINQLEMMFLVFSSLTYNKKIK
jgi:hypothetical protein